MKPGWKHLNLFINLVVVIVAGWTLWRAAPTWWQHWKMQGDPAPPVHVLDFEGATAALPLEAGTPSVIVFWASWCAPCEAELTRYAEAVREGSIDASSLYAVSIGEKLSTVKRVARERNYPFRVFADPAHHAASAFQVSATPTVVHLDADRTIDWITSGISPTLIWRAENHIPAPQRNASP